jgi:hypothetical protein
MGGCAACVVEGDPRREGMEERHRIVNVISGLDAAWAFPGRAGLVAFKAQGGKVVAGYLSYDPSKDWTAARLTMVHGLGLGALMNFEHTANRALSGHAAGVADGEHSWDEIAGLIRAVGYAPKNHLHIYASADFDAQPSQYPAIDAYLRGFAVGLLNRHANADQAVYGSYTLVVHTATAGHVEGRVADLRVVGRQVLHRRRVLPVVQQPQRIRRRRRLRPGDQPRTPRRLVATRHPLDKPPTPSPTPAPPPTQGADHGFVYRIDKADFEKALRGIVHDELSKQTRNELLPADAPADDKTKGPHRVETYLERHPRLRRLYSKR